MTQHRQVEPTSPVAVADAAIRALSIIKAAFVEDPPVRWLYPQAETYAEHFQVFAAALGAPAFRDGTFRLSDASAALWLKPGAEPDEAALGDVIKRSVPAYRQADVFAVVEAMDALHPPEPHWYLPFIGTRPGMQGRGLGAALITPVLEVCDRTGADERFHHLLKRTNWEVVVPELVFEEMKGAERIFKTDQNGK